jgi:putative phosphoesterase
MKIGIISDIHSNIYGLRAVLTEMDADKIICAGDITGYYTFVNEVFEELDKNRVEYIRGNWDNFLSETCQKNLIRDRSVRYTLDTIMPKHLEALKKASGKLNLELGGLTIKVHHASPCGAGERIYPDYEGFEKFDELGADVVVLGHTHYPIIKDTGRTLIINPGSCGQPRDYDSRASYAVLDTDTRTAEIKRVKYDYEKVIEEIRKKNMDQTLIDVLKRTK